jgi:anti-sigma-K factor RskA
MICPLQNTETTELLVEYCAKQLAPETASVLERHIEGCSACQAFTEAQSEVWSALDSWKPEPVSRNFDQRLYARIAAAERPSWRQWLTGKAGWRPALSLGAACAALAIAIFVNGPHTRTIGNQPPSAPVLQETPRADSIEPDQLERALDDLDMLNQLSPPAAKQL